MGVYRVQLQGIDLAGGAVVWPFLRGGSSPSVPLVVSQTVHEQVRKLRGQLDLRFKGPDVDLRILSVGILKQGQAVGPDKVQYTLGDRRARLAGLLVDKDFNVIRRLNERIIPTDNIDPNIAQFSAFPRLSFIKHTCRKASIGRDSSGQKFASGEDDDYEPWTALTALRWLLSDEGWIKEQADSGDATEFDGSTPFRFGKVNFSGATERKILLKSWNPRAYWPSAVNDLCRRGRLSLFLDPNGDFVVRDLEPDNAQFRGFGRYLSAGGIPIEEDISRSAPRRIRVRYRKRYEIRLDYSEARDFDRRPTRARGGDIDLRLRNVFMMPQAIDSSKAPGGKFQRAQYVDAFDALDAWDNDPVTDNNPKRGNFGRPWNVDNIRRYILHQSLAHNYSIDTRRPQFRNQILEARVAEVYQSFRRQFQLPEVLLDYIEQLDEASVEIIDPATGRRQPLPVFCDYISWDSVIYHGTKGAGNDGQGHVRSHYIKKGDAATVDPARIPLRDLEIAPARLGIVDPVLGIIRLEFTTDLKGTTVAYDPALATNIPSYNFTIQIKKAFTEQMIVLAQWRLSVLLSIRFRSNADETRFFDIVEDNPAKYGIREAQGPALHKVFSGFEAGYRWTDGQRLTIDQATNQLKVEGLASDALVNEGILRDTAMAEFETLYFDYRPRIVGVYAAKGWTGAMPSGQVTETAASYGGGGKMETMLMGSRPAPRPSIWEFLPPMTRDFIARLPVGEDSRAGGGR